MANQPQDNKAFKVQIKMNTGAPPPKKVSEGVTTTVKGPMRQHMKNSGAVRMVKQHNAKIGR